MQVDVAVGVEGTRRSALLALSPAIAIAGALVLFGWQEDRKRSEAIEALRRSREVAAISHDLLNSPAPGADVEARVAELASLIGADPDLSLTMSQIQTALRRSPGDTSHIRSYLEAIHSTASASQKSLLDSSELTERGAGTVTIAAIAAVLALMLVAGLLLRQSESNSRWAIAAMKSESEQSCARLELQRAALDGIGDGVIATNNSGRVLMMNSAAERLTGLAETCAMGRPVEDVFRIVNGETRGAATSPVREILRTGRAAGPATHTVLLSYTGEEIPVDHRGSPVRGRDGVLTGTVLVFRNVAEQRRAVEHSRRLAAIVENSRDAVISKTLDGIVTTWNPGAEMIFGYTAEEMIGCPISRLIPPERAEEAASILSEIRNGERVDHFETERVTKDGRRLTMSLTVSPILGDEGRVVGASKIARDITAQRQLEERLRQAQKMEAVGLLVGGIAHDFNNLLTVINGYADLLDGEIAPGSGLRQHLKQIRAAGEHAAALTQHLLTFSRKQVPQPRILDLNVWVADAKPLLERLIREEVQLVTDLGAGLPAVEADPNQLEQVLMNLVVNAMDAIPRAGTITIRTAAAVLDTAQARMRSGTAPGEYVILEVRDTGTGMEPAILSRIFEPFFSTKTVKGTGLGLSIVFGIVNQTGGFIDLKSEPQRGTSFRVYLPASRKALDVTRSASAPHAGSGNETILLVEDDARLREYAVLVLRRLGYHVIDASDGSQAVETARNSTLPIDLLVTDVIMPKMNGPAAAEAIRSLSPRTRVLYMSGYADESVSREVILTPGVNLLPKPFAPEELARNVRRVLDERKAAAGAA